MNQTQQGRGDPKTGAVASGGPLLVLQRIITGGLIIVLRRKGLR
jgi:hypothetical protein